MENKMYNFGNIGRKKENVKAWGEEKNRGRKEVELAWKSEKCK
jgi:hypothetical protein